MKKVIIVTVILFCAIPLAWDEPTVKYVEVVNNPYFSIQNQTLDVKVIDQSDEYEYKVIRLEDGNLTNAVDLFETALNEMRS